MKVRISCSKCGIPMECFPVCLSSDEYYQCPFCKIGVFLEEVFDEKDYS